MDGGQLAAILLTALLTFVATIGAQRLLEKRTGLRYRIRSSGDLVPSNAKVPLDIRYGEQRVRNLVLLQVDFINTGTVPIQRSVHEVKIEWNVPSGTLIREVADEKKIVMMGYVDKDGVEQRTAMIELLNDGGETSTMDFLVADEPKPTITIEARGIGVVGKPADEPSRLRPYAGPIGLVAWLLLWVVPQLFWIQAVGPVIGGDPVMTMLVTALLPLMMALLFIGLSMAYFYRR